MSRELISDVRLKYNEYEPFEIEMCEWQSNLRKGIRPKDEPCQNATEAAKPN